MLFGLDMELGGNEMERGMTGGKQEMMGKDGTE